jgi:ribosomal protein S18 acetylase RimI-like enzyme
MEEARIHIRYGVAADNTLLAQLGTRTFFDSFAAANTPENTAAYLAKSFGPEKQAAELAEPLSVFLIAEIDGAAAGFARLKEGQAHPAVSGVRPTEIVRIYACREWIGHGVGSALMRACLSEAEQRGCDVVWLGVWEHNPRAQAFYRKWGFEAVGTQLFMLGDDPQTDLVMQRPVKNLQNQ